MSRVIGKFFSLVLFRLILLIILKCSIVHPQQNLDLNWTGCREGREYGLSKSMTLMVLLNQVTLKVYFNEALSPNLVVNALKCFRRCASMFPNILS